MNTRTLKEPTVPKELTEIKKAELYFREAQDEETEIVQKKVAGEFLTKLKGDRLRFRQVVFENCRFLSSSFEEASFMDVKFVKCDFSNTNLSDAYFKYCSFQDCKAVGADFYGATFRHVTFRKCNIRDAGLDAARMSYVRAEETDFTGASFSKCGLDNTEWKKTCFQGVDFFKTLLKKVNFADCNIDGIIISDTRQELQGMEVNMFQALELAGRMGIVIVDDKP